MVNDGIHREDVMEKGAVAVVEEFNGKSETTYAYGKRVVPEYMVHHLRWRVND